MKEHVPTIVWTTPGIIDTNPETINSELSVLKYAFFSDSKLCSNDFYRVCSSQGLL